MSCRPATVKRGQYRSYTKLMRYLLKILAVLALMLPVLSGAQGTSEAWRSTESFHPSNYSVGGFAKENRVVLVRMDGEPGPAPCSVVCKDKNGATIWSYPLGVGSASALLTTSDDRIYIAFNQPNPSVIAFSQDGAFLWQNFYDTGSAPRHLSEMRIFGNRLLVSGTGRTVANGTGARPIMLAINRTTGATEYRREYLISGQPYAEPTQLRSSGTNAFVLARKAPNIASAILKIDPVNGEVIGSYVVGSYKVDDFQVDSAGAVYTVGSLNGAPEMRKVNGGGSGTFPLIYRRPWGERRVILSGGAAYTIDGTFVRKTRGSDGLVLWSTDFYSDFYNNELLELRADTFGRIHLLYTSRREYLENLWYAIDPVTGSRLFGALLMDAGFDRESQVNVFQLNSYGELLAAGYGPLYDDPLFYHTADVARFGQPLQVSHDSYLLAEGGLLTTSGNGVLANDRYANPIYCPVYKIGGSGPESGVLHLGTDGEFDFLARKSGSNETIPLGPQTFRYVVLRDLEALEAQVTINVVRAVSSVGFSYDADWGPQSGTGTVSLTSPGPTESVVSLSSNNPLLTVPASVSVPANAGSATFQIVVHDYVTSPTAITVTSSLNGISQTHTTSLQPAKLYGIKLTPSTVTGGTSSTLTVYLLGRAGPTPFACTIATDSAYCSPPASVSIPVGLTKIEVPVDTSTPPTTVQANVTVTGAGLSFTKKLTITP